MRRFLVLSDRAVPKSLDALGLRVIQCSTFLTRAGVHVLVKSHNGILDLGSQVVAVEFHLVKLVSTISAVPPDLVINIFGAILLNHKTNGVSKSHWIVGYISR